MKCSQGRKEREERVDCAPAQASSRPPRGRAERMTQRNAHIIVLSQCNAPQATGEKRRGRLHKPALQSPRGQASCAGFGCVCGFPRGKGRARQREGGCGIERKKGGGAEGREREGGSAATVLRPRLVAEARLQAWGATRRLSGSPCPRFPAIPLCNHLRA